MLSLCTINRYPSCLISCTHCGSLGASLATIGLHGSIKPASKTAGLRTLRHSMASIGHWTFRFNVPIVFFMAVETLGEAYSYG
jgi:hypothetical protein